MHENTQAECTGVSEQLLDIQANRGYQSENSQANRLTEILDGENIAVYCCDLRTGDQGQHNGVVQWSCRKRMHDGTTRALLIARGSDTEAHCIGLLAEGAMKMEEWDVILEHYGTFTLFS